MDSLIIKLTLRPRLCRIDRSLHVTLILLLLLDGLHNQGLTWQLEGSVASAQATVRVVLTIQVMRVHRHLLLGRLGRLGHLGLLGRLGLLSVTLAKLTARQGRKLARHTLGRRALAGVLRLLALSALAGNLEASHSQSLVLQGQLLKWQVVVSGHLLEKLAVASGQQNLKLADEGCHFFVLVVVLVFFFLKLERGSGGLGGTSPVF